MSTTGQENVGNHKLVITIDGGTGEVECVTKENGENIKKDNYRGDVNNHVKRIRPSVVYTSGTDSCITFVIGGEAYTYCW